jgi:predicted deacylase
MPSQLCESSSWVRAPAGGLLRIFRADGDVVAEGDLLAAVADPFGGEEIEILAPFGGIIVGRAVMPIINEGDALFHLARVKSLTQAEDMMDEMSGQLMSDPLIDEDQLI